MGKLGVLTFAEGDLDKTGFSMTLQLGDEGKPATIQETGSLPPNPEMVESYNSWKVSYYGFIGVKVRKLEAKAGQATNFSILDVKEKADDLNQKFNFWLKSQQFSHLREELRGYLKSDDEVRLIIQTSNIALRKLPWHLWDILERYPKAEISVSAPNFRQVRLAKVANNKVNILAILGDDDGINVEEDRKILNSIPGAKVKFLVKPNRQELNDQLWEQSWDILFFAGHSCTEGETGIISINKTESLTIPDLRFALKKAIEKGLQLAIFNSCDGLGLAHNLADLNLPQMIIMREPIPDKVAQEFLKYFLRSFSGGQSFYLAVKEARERLQGWESLFPCASWLPVICQNLAELPLRWQKLQKGLSDSEKEHISAILYEIDAYKTDFPTWADLASAGADAVQNFGSEAQRFASRVFVFFNNVKKNNYLDYSVEEMEEIEIPFDISQQLNRKYIVCQGTFDTDSETIIESQVLEAVDEENKENQ
jgi:CHAT domain